MKKNIFCFFGIFPYAEVRSKIQVFALNENRFLTSAVGSSTEGVGYSKTSAATNGLSKINKSLAALIEEEIKKW